MCQKARLCGKFPSIGHTPLNQSHIHMENTAHMSSKYTGSLSHLVTILVHQVIPPHPPSPPFPLPSCFSPLVNDVTRLLLAKKQQLREST